jgi:hypothetical protein
LLAATISLPRSEYTDPEQWTRFNEELLRRVERLAGVETAAYGVGVPFTAPPVSLPFELENRTPADAGARTTADVVPISPSYFRAMQIPVLRGRAFAASDTGESPAVGIINRAFARRFFGDEDPIGQHILIGDSRLRSRKSSTGCSATLRQARYTRRSIGSSRRASFHRASRPAPRSEADVHVATIPSNPRVSARSTSPKPRPIGYGPASACR